MVINMSVTGLETAVINTLRSNSSHDSPMTQCEIAEYIKNKYCLKADTRTLRRVLDTLSKVPDSQIKKTERADKRGKRSVWYAESRYSMWEIRVLTEALFFDPYISKAQRESLLEKLAQDVGISEVHRNVLYSVGEKSERKIFQRRVLRLSCQSDMYLLTQNMQSVQNIVLDQERDGHNDENNDEYYELLCLIDRAIREHDMLLFSLRLVGRNGELKLERDGCGRVREYLVRAISVAVCGGRYYLLAALGDSENMSYFPLERIYGLTLSGIFYRAAPLCGKDTCNIYPVNEAEKLRPCGGDRAVITVRAEESAAAQLFSSFPDAREVRCYGGKSEITFECSIYSAKYFLLQFGASLEVLVPDALRREIYEELKAAAGLYRVLRKNIAPKMLYNSVRRGDKISVLPH